MERSSEKERIICARREGLAREMEGAAERTGAEKGLACGMRKRRRGNRWSKEGNESVCLIQEVERL